MLIADPMYSSGDDVNSWLNTRGHSTVEINDYPQYTGAADVVYTNPDGEEEVLKVSSVKKQMGSLHPSDREFNSLYNYIKAETLFYKGNSAFDESFETTREALMLSPKFVIVTDLIKPDGTDGEKDTNKYSQYWHSLPGSNMEVNPETGIAKTNFETGANLTIVPVEGETDITATKHTGWYHTSNEFADYVRYDKEGDGTVAINTVLYPTTATEDIEVTAKKLSTALSEEEASAFSVTADDKKTGSKTEAAYYNLHDKTKRSEVQFGDFVTDGKLAYVQKTGGSLESAVLRGGKLLKSTNGEELIKSESFIPDIGVKWDSGDVYLYTSKQLYDESFAGEKAADVNLALGGEANSSLHFESSSPEKAVDGDKNSALTLPYEIVGGETPWISVDMGEEGYVSRIKICDDNEALSYSFYYAGEDGEWIEVEEASSYAEPLSEADKPEKIYEFTPFKARFIKACADEAVTVLLYELEAYSSSCNSVSVPDLSVYAPGSVEKVYLNKESITFYRNGDYIVFDEEKAEDSTGGESGSGSSGGSSSGHGSGGGSSSGKNETVLPGNPVAKPYENELSGHWGEKEISAMIEKGIVKGDGNTLNLKSPVTRAEFAALLVRALEIPEKEYGGEFADVKGDEWYAGTLAAAKSVGLMEGSDGKALPNDTLTREQMAKMLVSAKEYLGGEITDKLEITFGDKASVSDWAQEYIEKAVSASLMNGMGDNLFAPKETALREQAFAAVYRLLDK